jgi:hypothetical protein
MCHRTKIQMEDQKGDRRYKNNRKNMGGKQKRREFS